MLMRTLLCNQGSFECSSREQRPEPFSTTPTWRSLLVCYAAVRFRARAPTSRLATSSYVARKTVQRQINTYVQLERFCRNSEWVQRDCHFDLETPDNIAELLALAWKLTTLRQKSPFLCCISVFNFILKKSNFTVTVLQKQKQRWQFCKILFLF